MNSAIHVVVVQRVGGALDVLYVGNARGAAAVVVLQKIFCNPCYICAGWFRVENSGAAAVLWSWSQDQDQRSRTHNAQRV